MKTSIKEGAKAMENVDPDNKIDKESIKKVSDAEKSEEIKEIIKEKKEAKKKKSKKDKSKSGGSGGESGEEPDPKDYDMDALKKPSTATDLNGFLSDILKRLENVTKDDNNTKLVHINQQLKNIEIGAGANFKPLMTFLNKYITDNISKMNIKSFLNGLKKKNCEE